MKKIFIFAILIFLLCIVGINYWWTSLTHQPPKGIILISLDTLRADHLGIYGYHRDTSPAIDAFARESILFEHAVVQAHSTLPSHMSIMTSLYPSFHGVFASNKNSLADEHVTMAELLRAGGYKTAAFVDGGYVSATFGFYQGFDLYNDKSGGIVNILPKAKEWLEVNKSSPFFLFIHCYDIHDYDKDKPPSYNALFSDVPDSGQSKSGFEILKDALINKAPVDPEDLQHLIASYDGAIRYTDEKVGEFLSYLQASGLMDQSLIIITSDHGEEFMEHGYISHFQLYYRPHLHVPLIMRIPDYPRKKVRIEELVQSVDLLPTILDIVGLPAHSKAQGRSFIPLLNHYKSLFQQTLWQMTRAFRGNSNAISLAEKSKKWSIISAGYQMLYDVASHSWQLFNLKTDPFAKHDVAETHPDISQELLSQHQKIHNTTPVSTASKIDINEETRKQLEALGYVAFSEDISDDTYDSDKDGIQDDKDNCPSIANPNQEDTDRDRAGNLCDNCPDNYNPKQSDIDKEGIGDACDSCTDKDLDGYGNPGFLNTCEKDNCPYLFNPGQEDVDRDGIGDACEPPSLIIHNWLEAENADAISEPFEVAHDNRTSGKRYIYSPNGTGNHYSPGSIMAVYKVTIPKAGRYVLWGRVKVADMRDNSFFVQINDEDNLWEIERDNNWHWDAVNNRDGADPVKFDLPKGVYKIKVKLREDGTMLDKLLLTNNVDFIPSGKGGIAENIDHSDGY